MAFKMPQHMPRRPLPQDVSSKIIGRIDTATVKDLDASLANSWVTELDESISATKTRIHDRIQEDLPKFGHQLETSKSLQIRLQALSQGVDTLDDRISSPKGLLPTTLRTLRAHASLAQRASDAATISNSLSHLLKCKRQYTTVTSLAKSGKLPEALVALAELQTTCNESPKALQNAIVMNDLKHKLQTLSAWIEEQLLDALSNIVVVQASGLTVRSKVSVPNCDNATVSLEGVLQSLSPESLQEYLTSFRKHFTTYFIENVLQHPFSVGEGISMTEHVLNLISTSPNPESHLRNLAHVLDFAHAHIFSKLPESHSTAFPRSLAKSLTSSILTLFLAPQLPSSFGLLPPFLNLVKQAVEFEEEYIVGLLKGDARDRPLKEWSDSLSNHYERQRRDVILEKCRSLMKEPLDPSSTFLAELEQSYEAPLITAVNGEPDGDGWGLDDGPDPTIASFEEDSWGFDDDAADSKNASNEVEDSWGLDDDNTMQGDCQFEDSWGLDDSSTPEDSPIQNGHREASSSDSQDDGEPEPDPDDAWGWNDDKIEDDAVVAEDAPIEDNAWDDPWGEPEPKSVPAKTPKVAKRLEKLASKNKWQTNGSSLQHRPLSPLSQPPVFSPLSLQTTLVQSPPRKLAVMKSSLQKVVVAPKPRAIVTKVHPPVEHYRVAGRTKQIVRMVEDTIAEGKQFAASNLFSKLSSGSIPGSTLLQTAASMLDLYQALYHARFELSLETVEGALQFSNDCLYLESSVGKLEKEVSSQATLKERLSECKRQLGVLGGSWFQDAVERECRRHDSVLSKGTQGFTYTTDQDRYDECESAILQVSKGIKGLSRRIKPILPKNKYYQALGRLVDAALNRVLKDIIALPDITEVESHRLSELCRMFNALEGMFSEDASQQSFVVAYVPSWLKFNYLSELLEASLADITYLFEEGTLVDFEEEELVKLVRALFADTPLRTNTINKLFGGQP